MATAAELAETTVPKDIDSDSFLQTLKGNPPEKEWTRESLLYWEFYERGSAQAVRFGKWKAIRSPCSRDPSNSMISLGTMLKRTIMQNDAPS